MLPQDLRPGKCFGYSYSEILSFENRKMMYIPKGFAHGYLTLEDDTLMQWCVDQDFCGEAAQAVRYDDPDLVWKGEAWPKGEYIISEKIKMPCGWESCFQTDKYIQKKQIFAVQELIFRQIKEKYPGQMPGAYISGSQSAGKVHKLLLTTEVKIFADSIK